MNSKQKKNIRRFKEIRHEINKSSIAKSKFKEIWINKTTIGIKNVVSSKKTIVKLSIPNSSMIGKESYYRWIDWKEMEIKEMKFLDNGKRKEPRKLNKITIIMQK